ncbi:MAG: flagellar assembly protein FliW [bacterium]|nr:flagellar assembly protein FliW [bacterium]MCP5067369.1 flagellar assembly protein FliW [bacterium]
MSGADEVVIDHQRFGRLEIPADQVLAFDGLPGFDDARRFVLLRHDRDSAFLWLVSLDRSDLAFVVTNPQQFFPDYSPTLSRSQLDAVETQKPDGIELLAIATVRESGTTLNLAAPLLVNGTAGRGAQVILEQSHHSTRQSLPDPPAPNEVQAPVTPQIESKPQR